MIGTKLDVSGAIAELDDRQRRQIPFALSQAINDTVVEGRDESQKGMRRDLDRPTPWTQKGVLFKRSSKRNLQGAIYIAPNRWEYLQYQIEGGARRPAKRFIAIGLGKRNKYGNIPGMRTKVAKLLAKPDHFQAEINGTVGVWRRMKRGLRLVVAFRRRAQYSPKWQFFRRAEKHIEARFPIFFRRRLAKALETSR